MHACDRCHRRKSRCDKGRPRCGVCEKSSAECSYSDRSRDPSIRKEHVEGVERRLRQEEAKNQALSRELARLRSLTTLHDREASSTPRGDVVQHPATPGIISRDVINEVSFLASTAAGERHYLGSTSGVLFAQLVRASVDVTPIVHDASSMTSACGLLGSQANAPNSFNPKDTLPPKGLAKELFDNYFAHDHLCYPFLLPSSTFPIIDSIYADPSFYAKNAFEAFVVDMILAIATTNVYKFDWQMLPGAETHHARAMHRATEVFQLGGLRSLQAILLLCQYRTSSSMQDTSASMWHLVGIAVRISYELGLHRESAYTISGGSDADGENFEKLQHQEIRRRCFWSVLCMDRIVGITLGRPLAIDLESIDVELPSMESDLFIHSESRLATDASFNKTSIFVHFVKYRLLCGKIVRKLHSPKKVGDNETMMHYLRDDLASELADWQRKSHELKLPEQRISSPTSQSQSSFLSKEWYEVLHHNAMLMLFRPCPMLSDTRDSSTLQKLFKSSKEAISLYASLHRSRKINFSWITLHSVFMAGLTYLYALSRHFRERRKSCPAGAILSTDPTAIEIVNDTRACSNVLVAVSERWNALRSCHEVFDKLSDAVLSDAIKLQCSLSVTQAQTPSTPQHLQIPRAMGHSDISSSQSHIGNNGSHSYKSSWADNDYTNPTAPFLSGTSSLAIDSEFRNCFGDLQSLYSGPFADDPVMQLSQDWMGYIDGFESILQPTGQGVSGSEIQG